MKEIIKIHQHNNSFAPKLSKILQRKIHYSVFNSDSGVRAQLLIKNKSMAIYISLSGENFKSLNQKHVLEIFDEGKSSFNTKLMNLQINRDRQVRPNSHLDKCIKQTKRNIETLELLINRLLEVGTKAPAMTHLNGREGFLDDTKPVQLTSAKAKEIAQAAEDNNPTKIYTKSFIANKRKF